MQVVSSKTDKFEPVTIKIMVESEEDHDTLKSLARTDNSVPKTVSKAGFALDKYSESGLDEFLRLLRLALS